MEHSEVDKTEAGLSLRPRSCRLACRGKTGPGPRPREQEIARVAVVVPSDVRQQRSATPEDNSVTFNRVKMRIELAFFEVSRIASTFSTGSFLAWPGLVLVRAAVLGSRSFNGIACAGSAVQKDWECAAL